MPQRSNADNEQPVGHNRRHLLVAAITHSLQSALPVSLHSVTPDLASILADVALHSIPSTSLKNDPEEGLDLTPLLHVLAGRKITTNSAQIMFGQDSQMGDVTVNDVAGGNITKVSLTLNFNAPLIQQATKAVEQQGTREVRAPRVQREQVYTNLLPVVSFAPHIYVAATDLRRPGAVWQQLHANLFTGGGEWVLREGQIISFHDLRNPFWDGVCDQGTVEEFAAQEWALSHDIDRENVFVELLNWALDVKVQAELLYSREKGCYFFKPTEDRSTRQIAYRAHKVNTQRQVFQGYASKKDPDTIMYYRHSAFEGRFKRYGESWFLEITPTHYYTADGYRRDRYYEQRLRGIRRLEKNQAVVGQLLMWSHFLSGQDLFTEEYPFLSFGPLASFDVEASFDERAWQKGQDARAGAKPSASSQLSLFEES